MNFPKKILNQFSKLLILTFDKNTVDHQTGNSAALVLLRNELV